MGPGISFTFSCMISSYVQECSVSQCHLTGALGSGDRCLYVSDTAIFLPSLTFGK